MLVEAMNTVFYGVIFLSLFLIDYFLGNGFVDMFRKVLCTIVCFVKKTIREEVKHAQIAGTVNNISVSVLFTEILVLSLTIAFLHKYKQFRVKDRIDELLKESKDALKQTNEFLEKWRLRRINWQTPSEYSYLDEEPQEIKPLKLEVPILHMAIIDTLGSRRGLPERGDAGDTVNITDSTLLSVTSLIDDDFDIPESVSEEKNSDETRNIEFKNRFLWDVMEEDANDLND